jgi:hypothetical protein
MFRLCGVGDAVIQRASPPFIRRRRGSDRDLRTAQADN